MGKRFGISMLAAAMLIALPVLCNAQAKVYTKKAMMEGFCEKTTKVVLSGESLLELTVKDEIIRGWRISPFEFCTVKEYESLKTNHSLYFLRLISDEGLVFLSLSMGGKKEDENMLRRPFEVVRIPIASDGASSGREFSFMGAFIDIIQRFTEDAMDSDRIGYSGLAHYNTLNLKGWTISLLPEAGDVAMSAAAPGHAAGICISPYEVTFNTECYKMVITSDTHELLYFKRTKYRGPADREFSDHDARLLEKRHAVVER